ncbi:MAG: fibronectin type III domain-containing protein [Candidatus Acidoferrales bacterium]|nr:fibronectin type III domain-containing protein [Candidatus Acidoferrales bacterium]
MEKGNGAPSPELTPNEHVRPANFLFLFSIFLVSLIFTGCAAPGEPYERKPPTPAAVADLTAAQAGNDVILTFTLPQQTVDRRPLQQLPAIEIYRDFGKPPAEGQAHVAAPENATLLVTIPAAIEDRYLEQGRIHFSDTLRAEDFAQHPDSVAIYTVRTRISEKKPSANSNVASVRLYPALDAIGDLKAENTRSGVALTWTAPEKTPAGPAPAIAGYRIYRGEPEPAAAAAEGMKLKSPLVKIGEAQSTSYQDAQFELGASYVYSVRSVAQYPGEALESGDSNLAVVTPRDTFPPAAPQGLLVVLVPAQGGAAAHLELSWAISPETDIAGYNVYRGDQESTPGTRLNTELLLTPAFRDMNIQPGHRYFYSVTAVDRTGNESPLGAVVSGGVPAESQATP